MTPKVKQTHDLYKIVDKTDNYDGTHRLKIERPAIGSETPIITEIDIDDEVAVKAVVGEDLYARFDKPEVAG